jgi:hypothetical protein
MKGGDRNPDFQIYRRSLSMSNTFTKKPKEFMMVKVRLILVFTLIALLAVAGSAMARPLNFRAHLSGGQEVPPVETNATGQAVFQLNSSGDSLSFKLIVANIHNVFAAHIHCAPAGQNGPVGVTLFFSPPPNLGRVDGILAQGTISDPIASNACGWADLDDVVSALASGDTYVNVHTNPGFPTGEIRGQIR